MKKLIALLLALVMVFALAACGPASNPGAESTPPAESVAPSEAQTPSGNEGGEKVYTTVISDADVTLTVSADQKSLQVDAMGMTVKGSCEVVDNVLTVKEQTEGNAQVWASLSKNTFTLNDDGTATAVPVGGADEGGEKVYTTVISDADVTLTVSADQKSLTVDAMGMTVKGSCEVVGNVLTVKEQTEGNAQVWASLAQNTFTLNDDGTATAVPAGEGGGEAGESEELFAWDGYATLVFNKDGTYDFSYMDGAVSESGTWKWENWQLTVIDAEGNEMTGAVDEADDNALKFTFTALINSQLVVDFTAASSVWGPALGASGTYTP